MDYCQDACSSALGAHEVFGRNEGYRRVGAVGGLRNYLPEGGPRSVSFSEWKSELRSTLGQHLSHISSQAIKIGVATGAGVNHRRKVFREIVGVACIILPERKG